MKIRNGFVSNSSSQSFMIRGVLLKYEAVGMVLGINLDKMELYEIERILKQKSINLDTLSPRYYFGGENTKDIILGISLDSLEDSEVREITDKELTANDDKIKKELEKLNMKPESLSTFIQYISNDNC